MRQRQTGFSLVELMVAMLLGLLITAAAVSLFSTNQRTFQLQQAQSQLQEQGQLAMRFIINDVRMAGFVDPEIGGQANAGVLVTASGGLSGSNDGGAGGNDRLTIAYDASADCEGNTTVVAPATAQVVNTYWVDDDGDLMCQGNQASPLTGGVKLLSEVQSFQVLYGIDTEKDEVPFAAQYVTAGNIGGRMVLAVKLSLLLKETVHSLGGSDDEKTYYVLDQDIKVNPASTLFRQFSSSVSLRNYPWDKI